MATKLKIVEDAADIVPAPTLPDFEPVNREIAPPLGRGRRP